ncbi:MAG: ATP-binding protein [Candidatus Wallbacteria bacterium]|nr:ATP-binding protein [Candidatus Wallbacteria bacterium]
MKTKPKQNLIFFLISLGLFLNLVGILSSLDDQHQTIFQIDELINKTKLLKCKALFLNLNRIRDEFLLSSGKARFLVKEHEFVQELTYFLGQLETLKFRNTENTKLLLKIPELYNEYEKQYLLAASSLAGSDFSLFSERLQSLILSTNNLLNMFDHLQDLSESPRELEKKIPWIYFNFCGILLLFIALLWDRISRNIALTEPAGFNLAALSSFMGGLAHEIKNPLAGIQANLELLSLDKKSEELSLAIKECRRLYRLLDGYLDFLRPGKWNPVAVNFQQMSLEVEALQKKEISAKKLTITSHFTKTECELDQDRFKQIFLNLMQNAIKASPENSSIELRSFLRDKSLIFQVCDQGPGVPAEVGNKIFYPFYSVNKGGSGLGLFICVNILSGIDGEIRYFREKNRTVFEVKIPSPGQ